ncbi:MAG: hypothetical protein E7A11_15375 [Clostridium sp.]|uniref:hypothetical protein n=1 Tax=Clostridium TaxID=1485 RepID=UPI0015D4DFB6|nr:MULTISPECIES: hypothetical protein [Clostridium]MBS6887616.1 hypothetical protein [Clostridium sp.]MBS7131878.1 hypothetical protein [Clostridium sp.]MDB2104761.1 hypothetical protein [Clostridium paraputrificum]MDU1126652.1 hypothetical protein [Clostridium sp.]MDU2284180.1 hypothetical protein [Clostridium sp.]
MKVVVTPKGTGTGGMGNCEIGCSHFEPACGLWYCIGQLCNIKAMPYSSSQKK